MCDVAFAALLFREAQRSARAAGLPGWGTLDEAIAHSRRMGDNPWKAAGEEFSTAQNDFSAGKLALINHGGTEP